MNYTSEEIVKKLKEEEGTAISVRTLNYYAYDKKMFPNLGKGKSCYSDNEFELLKRIAFLKDKTSMTLDEIRECISNDDAYNSVSQNIMVDTVSRVSKTQSIPRGVSISGATDCATTSSVSFCEANLNASPLSTPTSPVFTNCVADSMSACASTDFSNSCTINETIPNNEACLDYLAELSILSQSPQKTQNARNAETTVKINKDITITVSENVSRENLIEIINYINSLKG